MTATNVKDMFLFPIMETDDQGNVLLDNRDRVFTRGIHPSEVDLPKYIANRDEYLYHDITSQAEREFDTILHQDCLRRQDEARKAHFIEQGLPGYQPFLLQDGIFSTLSGETNYRISMFDPQDTPSLGCQVLQQVTGGSPAASTSGTTSCPQLLRQHHLLLGP